MRFLFYILFYLNVLLLNAKTLHAIEPESSPKTIVIPPPIQLDNDLWLPSVNQFIIIPMAGYIWVHYIGLFNNLSQLQQKKKTFFLPLPKGTKIKSIADMTLNEGVEQIKVSFKLPTLLGRFHWEPNSVLKLPGVTILMISDPSAKIMMKSADFITNFKDESFSGQQFVRVSWDKNTAYPVFDLMNSIPSRIWIYVWLMFIGLIIFSTLFFFVKILSGNFYPKRGDYDSKQPNSPLDPTQRNQTRRCDKK